MQSVQSTKLTEPVVELRDLKMHFPVTRGLLKRTVAHVKAVDGISLSIRPGETLGLVGESGSGKTTLGRCILRLYDPTSGSIFFEGQDIASLPQNQIRPIRRKITMIFQDPQGSLDPRQSARNIVAEPLKIHGLANSKSEQEERVTELFKTVGLLPSMMDRVPHEFSGGQRQRLGVARALAGEASFIICDEPVSALDVSIQAQILNLLSDLRQKIAGLTYLFIAHDLSVVKHISDRIAVMYLGRIVEITDSNEIYENPLHPYTQALLSAVPVPDPFVEEVRECSLITGEIPSPLDPPKGCNFNPRCPKAIEQCRVESPPLLDKGGGHEVACHRV